MQLTELVMAEAGEAGKCRGMHLGFVRRKVHTLNCATASACSLDYCIQDYAQSHAHLAGADFAAEDK